MNNLPYCSISYPTCGACGEETECEGDSFYCEPCGLDYGDGRDGTAATYIDPEAAPCCLPCDEPWHRTPRELGGVPYKCTPCLLPQGHEYEHWTNCQPILEGDTK